MSEENVEVVRRVTEVMDAEGFEAALPLFLEAAHPDVEWREDPAWPGFAVYQGVEEVQRVIFDRMETLDFDQQTEDLIAVDDKESLMVKMGRKTLDIVLADPLAAIPAELGEWNVRLEKDGNVLCYEFDSHAERTGIASLMRRLAELGISYKDLSTHQSSLEDIFVELVHRPKEPA